MKIYLIRHGQTDKNLEGVMQGRSDYPLNAEGLRQTQQTASWFASNGIVFDRIFASPLKRAVRTAQCCTEDPSMIETDERLLEMDYGPYEGISLKNLPPEILEFFGDFVNVPAPAGMEQLADVVTRMGDFLESLKSFDEGDTILISTHAIALKGALEYLDPNACGRYWSKFIGNCAVYKVDCIDGQFSLPVYILR